MTRPVQRVAEIRTGRLQAPVGEIGQSIGIGFTGDQRGEDRSAADADNTTHDLV